MENNEIKEIFENRSALLGTGVGKLAAALQEVEEEKNFLTYKVGHLSRTCSDLDGVMKFSVEIIEKLAKYECTLDEKVKNLISSTARMFGSFDPGKEKFTYRYFGLSFFSEYCKEN